MTHPAKVREPTLLAEEMAALCAESKRTGSTFALGALDALRWLTDGGPGPLTGRAAQKPAPVRAVAGELAVAEGRIYGKNSEHARYAQGVLHALMWAQYATAAPPHPIGFKGASRHGQELPVEAKVPRPEGQPAELSDDGEPMIPIPPSTVDQAMARSISNSRPRCTGSGPG